MAYQETAAAHQEHHHVKYGWIFFALCVCTLLSVIFDVFSLPGGRRVVALLVLAVAVAKAQYVMRYFMHLKFEGAWKYVLLLPTAILAVGLPLALAPDIGLHYYTPDVPQIRAGEVPHAEMPHSGAPHPEAAAEHGADAHAAGEGH